MTISTDSIPLTQIGADAGIPGLNVADIPENIRDGDSRAREAYTEGLAFEKVLVNELTEQLASTMNLSDSGGDGSADAGSDGTTSSSGLLSGQASAYSSLIPSALTSAIMDDGGLGMASQLAASLDPSIDNVATTGSNATTSTTTAGSSTSSGGGASL